MTKTFSYPNQFELDREVAVELNDRVDLLNRYFQSVYSDRTPKFRKSEEKEDAVPGIHNFSVRRREYQKF